MRKATKSDAARNLYQVPDHSLLRILLISGGWDVRRSFNQIGIHAGDCIQVVRRAPFGGPLVIDNQGLRVAIGKQLAEKVRVQLLP